jgi:hypothetical protein
MSNELSYACPGCGQPIDAGAADAVPVWTVIEVPGSGRRNEWIPVEGWIAHRHCLSDVPWYREGPIVLGESDVLVTAERRGGSLRQFVRSLGRPRRVLH